MAVGQLYSTHCPLSSDLSHNRHCKYTKEKIMPLQYVKILETVERQLTSLAEFTSRTKSWIINQAIQDYLARELWQINEINKIRN